MATATERDLLNQIFTLRSVIRGKDRQIRDLKSGATYVSLQSAMAKDRRHHEARVGRLEEALSKERRAHAKDMRAWMATVEEIASERDAPLARKAARLEARALRAERKVDELKDELCELKRDIAERDSRIEELEGLVAKFEAQVAKNFENSSIPSSKQGPGRKPIPNTRERTGRKRGAQTGHPHHPRRRPEPDLVVELGPPEGALEDDDLYPTGDVIAKTVVSLELVVRATEYRAQVWRRRSTGARVHAPFPEGVDDEVTYDGSVKAFCFMLTQGSNTSVRGTSTFLREATKGELNLSTGMIWNLAREFREKTEPERAASVEALMGASHMGADFTDANVDGSHAQVLILANDDVCQMYAREHKGHKGVADTPLERYVGLVVSDADPTFESYGTGHQSCLAHIVRYLTGSIQNEPHLTWNARMLQLIREMLHWRRSVDWEDPPGKDELRRIVDDFKRRYDKILDLADREYEKHPPGKYNREGFNLSRRLRRTKESVLAFLERPDIPADNSRCERLARVFKRRQHSSIVFRSMEGLALALNAITVIENIRNEGGDVFASVEEIFNR